MVLGIKRRVEWLGHVIKQGLLRKKFESKPVAGICITTEGFVRTGSEEIEAKGKLQKRMNIFHEGGQGS